MCVLVCAGVCRCVLSVCVFGVCVSVSFVIRRVLVCVGVRVGACVSL